MEFEDAADYVGEITTKFGCTPDDMMFAMYEKDSELWEYIDRYMSWAAIEEFVDNRNDPFITIHLNEWMREYNKHCSCAIYRTHKWGGSLGYKLSYHVYFPSEKHKAKFLLAYGPFT